MSKVAVAVCRGPCTARTGNYRKLARERRGRQVGKAETMGEKEETGSLEELKRPAISISIAIAIAVVVLSLGRPRK